MLLVERAAFALDCWFMLGTHGDIKQLPVGKMKGELGIMGFSKHTKDYHLELNDLAEVCWPCLPLIFVYAAQFIDS